MRCFFFLMRRLYYNMIPNLNKSYSIYLTSRQQAKKDNIVEAVTVKYRNKLHVLYSLEYAAKAVL